MASKDQPPAGPRLLTFDEKATYLIKGATLRRLCKGINEWTNLEVQWGLPGSAPALARGEVKSTLSIPPWQGGGGGALVAYPFKVEFISAELGYGIKAGTASYLHRSYLNSSGITVVDLNTPFAMSTTLHAWIEILVDVNPAVGICTFKTGSAFPATFEKTTIDGYDYQTKYNLPVGRVVTGAQPGIPGFDFKISDVTYHWQQLLREHQILESYCFAGVAGFKPCPWQGV